MSNAAFSHPRQRVTIHRASKGSEKSRGEKPFSSFAGDVLIV